MTFTVGQEVEITSELLRQHLIDLHIPTTGVIFAVGSTSSSVTIGKVLYILENRYLQPIASKVAEKDTFNSQQEIWEYLATGGKVCNVVSKKVLYFNEGKVCTYIGNSHYAENAATFHNYEQYTKHKESAIKWYNIPKEGVLCWVNDVPSPSPKKIYLHIITNYNEDIPSAPFRSPGGIRWKYATPITKEEVSKLIYQPE